MCQLFYFKQAVYIYILYSIKGMYLTENCVVQYITEICVMLLPLNNTGNLQLILQTASDTFAHTIVDVNKGKNSKFLSSK